jgi:hypothetical protein
MGIQQTITIILEVATVTDSALFMMYSEKDTLFLHADTLRTMPDTIPDEKLIKAYYGTRFFRPTSRECAIR